jgi:iron complex outermembrane receptor protein
MRKKAIFSSILFLLFVGLLSAPPCSIAQEKEQEEGKQQKLITEEIVVEAERPKDVPLSTTSLIKQEKIQALKPRDLSEVLSFTSGTFVSTGSKNEFQIKIRGFQSQQVILLFDGIPVYEPFFNSFDLKTFPAEEIENVKVIKGASSVLYGPNALGGVVNIITRRPEPPSFSLSTSYDSQKAFNLASTGSVRWKNVFLTGFVSYDNSDGFRWNQEGEHKQRDNSDYRRANIMGKLYFYPNQTSEILFETAFYTSEYGIPPATEYYRPRYWRFKDWDRLQFNLGGTFSFLKRGNIKFRSYYVHHFNVLDAYTGPDFNEIRWESTYKNDSYGAFLLGSVPYLSDDELKFSLNFRNDRARTQDDMGKEWEEFEHQTASLGLESHFRLDPKWRLVAGASLDHLRKHTGENKTSLNPIAGLKFNPLDYIDLHASFSQKSRFPSMRSLYSTIGGNPNLKHERGTNYELGFSYRGDFLLAGAAFYNRIRDLIQPIRLPDGSQSNLNIGRAKIAGFELEFGKAIDWGDISVNYTFLHGVNEDEDRPIDLVPESQLNFVLNIFDKKRTRFSLWGLYVSSAEVEVFGDIIKIPGYFVLNAKLSYEVSSFVLFLKGENLLDSSYVTEPGFPMKARAIALGFKYNIPK